MKKSHALINILLSVLLPVLGSFGGCVDLPFPTHDPYEFPEFSTQYTEEEHIQRLSARTEERFADYIESERLLDYEVELVYSFYNEDPEYFLIEIEYWGIDSSCQKNEAGAIQSIIRYAHAIGYLKNDEYYFGLNSYSMSENSQNELDGFILDKSLWQIFDCDEGRKYYGSGVQAVQTDEGILQLCSGSFHSEDMDIDSRFILTSSVFEQKIINPNDYERLMHTTWRRSGAEY